MNKNKNEWNQINSNESYHTMRPFRLQNNCCGLNPADPNEMLGENVGMLEYSAEPGLQVTASDRDSEYLAELVLQWLRPRLCSLGSSPKVNRNTPVNQTKQLGNWFNCKTAVLANGIELEKAVESRYIVSIDLVHWPRRIFYLKNVFKIKCNRLCVTLTPCAENITLGNMMYRPSLYYTIGQIV